MKFKALFYLLIVGFVALQSCGKTGNIGPKGNTGAAGPTGPIGNTGATGAMGNANVSSYIFLNQSVVFPTTPNGYGQYIGDKLLLLPDSNYTKAYNGGLIFCYYRNPSDTAGNWYAANSNFYINMGVYDNTNILFTIGIEGVRMVIMNLFEQPPSQLRIDVEIILVPASSVTTVTGLGINFNNLKTVKKALYLK
jgi:Tfp pilus assembly protein PilZ